MTASAGRRGLVLVTGGSGYIAGFCIAALLEAGWRVRTTLRRLEKAAPLRAGLGRIGVDAAELDFFAADLNHGEGWAGAAAGADFVLHVAAPVPAVDPKSDDELIRPMRDGALRVLKAARDAGVKRVVMTSSVSAIVYRDGADGVVSTEAEWSDEANRAGSAPYDRAKTIAERAAWAWHSAEGGRLELVMVNPSFVLGPVLGADFSASVELVKRLLDGSVPALPRVGVTLVDVRDVAALHLLAMTTPSAAGQRYIGAGEFFWIKDIARVLRDGLGDGARRVPTRLAPDWAVRLAGLVDPIVRSRLFELGKERRVSSAKARSSLGWTTRPSEETILDAGRSLLELGLARS
jgi:nucleoside-diphosphate-sugar epimerase